MAGRVPKAIKEEIVGKVKAGERVVDLAEQYGVSDKTIYGWLRQRTGVVPSPNLSGSREASLPRSPLRTVRESFPSYRSSLSNARCRTRFHNG